MRRWNLAGPRPTALVAACSLALAIALSGAGRAGAQEAAACPVDPAPCCNFDSGAGHPARAPIRAGVHIWTHDLPAATQDIVEAQPKVLRFAIGPWWKTEDTLALDADFAAVRAHVDRAFAKREAYYRREIEMIGDLRRRTGAELHLVIWEPPLTAAEDLVKFKQTDDRKLEPAALAVTARFYAAFLASLSARGLDVDIVELSNEPDGAWNIRIDPQMYVDLLEATRAEARRHGVRLPAIAGPGVALIASLPGYLGPPERSARLFTLLDHVSVHAWDDRNKRDIVAEAGKARALLDARGWRGRIMATEVSVTFPTEEDRARNLGPTRKGADVVTNRGDYAAALAETSLGLAMQGFDTLVSWQLKDPPWDPFSYGLIDAEGRRRPGFAAWRDVAARLHRSRIVTVRRAKGAPVFALYEHDEASGLILFNRGATPAGVALAANQGAGASAPCRAPNGRPAFGVAPGGVRVLR